MEENKVERFELRCDCRCGILEFEKFDFGKGDTGVSVNYYVNGFYGTDNSFWENLKLIWNIIRGRKYQLYDIVIYKNQWNKFKEFVNEE